MNIGHALKEIRKGKGLTQKQLAGKINISNTYLSEIENNTRRPSIEVIKGISDALDIPFVYLILKSLEKEDLKDESKEGFLQKVSQELDRAFI